ncbi:MAG: branched-chain amino acid ABC transporter permease [Acidilobaceae archaeon]
MDIISLIFDGVILGLIFSLIASGLTLIYGLGNVLNLAHGELLVLSTVTTAVLSQLLGLPLILALLLGVIVTLLASAFLDKILLIPAYRLVGEDRIILGLYMTLALAYSLHGGLITAFPNAYLTINVPFFVIEIAWITLRSSQLIAALASFAILVSLYLFLKRTWHGMAIRSLTQNEIGAMLVGIPIKKYRLMVFIIGGLIVSLAGFIRSVVATVGPESGVEFTILGLLVCVIGGVRSISGTIFAGILTGLVYTFLIAMIGTYLAYVMLLVFVMITVLVRPQGILGERW